MLKEQLYNNQALFSSPVGFGLPEYVFWNPENEVEYYRPKPRALEYCENGDTIIRLYYWKQPEIRSAEIKVFGKYQGTPGEALKMTEGENHVWSVRVPGIEPGVHGFQLIVNGLPCLHPEAPVAFNGSHMNNYLDVPDPEDDTYLLKDVPHGSVRTEYYYSEFLRETRTCLVYTPPGYDEDTKEEYPVLYLQHGAGENEMGWFHIGKANLIMDNLLAEGKCRRMLVVMNNGFVYRKGEDYREISHLRNLASLLIQDCAPFIESRFRVKKGKEFRAVAGLSMGSHETMVIAYEHPEFADYLGFMSGANLAPINSAPFRFVDPIDVEGYYQDIDAFNASHKLLYISQGEAEGGLTLRERMKPYLDRGIRAEIYTCPGAHEFQTWRRSLYVFAQKLFV